jgi:coenzyme F420-reducing hydrogenase beta subunit
MFVLYSLSSFCFSSKDTSISSLKQTKISCNIDTSLKNLTTSIQSFGEVVVESKPCEINLVRKKNKQAQMMRSELLSPMLAPVLSLPILINSTLFLLMHIIESEL